MAIAASWLLAVQAVVSGLAFAGHAQAGSAQAGAGSLAAVICTPDGLRPVPGGDPAEAPVDPHDMSCCLIGCTGAGPSAAPPVATVLPPAPATVARVTVVPADPAVSGRRHSPRSTRAPPTTA